MKLRIVVFTILQFFLGFELSLQAQNCSCTEMIYLNEPEGGGKIYKFEVASSGALTEVGSPWFDNTAEAEQMTSPHGLATDLNGYLYIAETRFGDVRKFTCDGEIFPETGVTGFSINVGVLNMGSIGNHLFTSRDADLNMYDLCTGTLIGEATLCEEEGGEWGYYVDQRTGQMYATGNLVQSRTNRFWTFNENDFDSNPSTCISETVLTNFPTSDAVVLGVTSDINGNIYIAVTYDLNPIPGEESSYILKYGPAPSFNYIATSPIDYQEDGNGYFYATGIVYSETSDKIYVSSQSPIEDCIAVFDTDLTPLPAFNIASNSNSTNAKGIAILKECCPLNNNVVIDTILCDVTLGSDIFLQEIINCEGTVCEGQWEEEPSNTGMTYNSCNNTVTINAANACGSFTLESNGTGNNPQCSSFSISLNISLANTPSVSVSGDQTHSCPIGSFTPLSALTGADSIQWQISTVSCSNGWTDLAGATNSSYTPNGLTDTTYYRVKAINRGSCATEECAVFSDCITVNVEENCVITCTNPTADIFAIQTSCNADGTINSDGYLQISALSGGDRYNWSPGSTFSGNTDYAAATGISGLTFPIIAANNLSNPSGTQDYTFRVFNGESNCYSDITVTMNEQDCTIACSCTEMIYLNEPTTDGAVHKFSIASDGDLTEIGNPWFDNAIEMAGLTSPHGLGTDLNGFVYIAETSSGDIRRFSCDGEIFPESGTNGFIIDNGGGTNFGSLGNNLFTNNGPNSPTDISMYDLCTGSYISEAEFCEAPPLDWGLHVDKRTGRMYATSSLIPGFTNRFWTFDINDFDNDPSTCVNETTLSNMPTTSSRIMGVTTDNAENLYLVVWDDSQINPGYNSSYVLKYSPYPDFNFIARSPLDTLEEGSGYQRASGIVYSGTADRLYVSTQSVVEDCVSVFDTDLNYLGIGVPNPGTGDNAKGIALNSECCPTNNNVNIDTTLCSTSTGTVIFLQELINCEGSICEGLWGEDAANTGLTYNDCNNSVTVNAEDACGSFTLESDGTGNSPQCSAFKITVNVELINFSSPQYQADTTLCTGADPESFRPTTPVSPDASLSYQWQSSITDSLTGFTDIPGAVSTSYDPPEGIRSNTYYRLITTKSGNCTLGMCRDTGNLIVLNVRDCDFTSPRFPCTIPACHFTSTDIYLGTGVSPEDPGAEESSLEDGIIFPNDLIPGNQIRLPVNIYNNTGNTAYLNAWIDWNGDEDFDDSGEQIVNQTYDFVPPNTGAFTVYIPVTIPVDASEDTELSVRWRLSSDNSGIAAPCGPQSCANDGEVEDYRISLLCSPGLCLPPEQLIIRN